MSVLPHSYFYKCVCFYFFFFFFFNDTATTEIYTLSLHDALPIRVHRAVQEWRLGLLADGPFERLGPFDERRVAGRSFQGIQGSFLQHPERVVADLLHELGVELPEQPGAV